MNERPPSNDLLDQFFTEGARTYLSTPLDVEILVPESVGPIIERPLLEQAERATPAELQAYWRILRLFHHSGKGGGMGSDDQRPVPAVFEPFLQAGAHAGFYPCWVGTGLEATCLPLEELIRQSLNQFAPEAHQGRLIKDQLPRLLLGFRRIIGQKGIATLVDGWPTVRDQFSEDLALQPSDAAVLDDLGRHLPRSGYLIDFSHAGILQILAILVNDRHVLTRRLWMEEVGPLKDRISALLAVEKEKGIDARTPENLRSRLDFADAFLNFEELSDLLPDQSSSQIPQERLHRLEEVRFWLDEGPDRLFAHPAWMVVQREQGEHLEEKLDPLLPEARWVMAERGHVLQDAIHAFQELTALAARFFSAVRIAQLELADQYDPTVHDHFFVHFNWASFTPEEQLACPPVVALTDRKALLSQEALAFGKVLTMGWPIRTVCLSNPYPEAAEEWAYRAEPGMLALAYRDAFVLQTSAVDPTHLYHGLSMGLRAENTALFHILDPGDPADLLGHHAALLSRESPSFLMNGDATASWGSRFSVADNPEPDADWVSQTITCRLGGEEIEWNAHVTPVDYASLFPRLLRHFQVVPETYVTDDLVPVTDYLNLRAGDRIGKVPYIWMILPDRRMVRAAVTMTLTRACEERLGFWHVIQEYAGIHNFHADQVREQLSRSFEEELEQTRKELEATHAETMAAAVEKAGRAAMEDLARVLLDMDPVRVSDFDSRSSARIDTPRDRSVPAAALEPQPEPAKTTPEATKAAPKPSLVQDAWIDSALCTSCNECINLNKRMFRYNDQKQAVIADVQAGTFAELVRAAEACPVSIIHPGAPHNPAEPGLTALIEKASAWN